MAKESTVTEQPEQGRPKVAATPQPATVELPRASRARKPAATVGAEPTAPESQVKRRRSRRQDDDFGDFTYLHDPAETEPDTQSGSTGRRAL
jgi:hypothetical protein